MGSRNNCSLKKKENEQTKWNSSNILKERKKEKNV